jgi:hypothetical protein
LRKAPNFAYRELVQSCGKRSFGDREPFDKESPLLRAFPILGHSRPPFSELTGAFRRGILHRLFWQGDERLPQHGGIRIMQTQTFVRECDIGLGIGSDGGVDARLKGLTKLADSLAVAELLDEFAPSHKHGLTLGDHGKAVTEVGEHIERHSAVRDERQPGRRYRDCVVPEMVKGAAADAQSGGPSDMIQAPCGIVLEIAFTEDASIDQRLISEQGAFARAAHDDGEVDEADPYQLILGLRDVVTVGLDPDGGQPWLDTANLQPLVIRGAMNIPGLCRRPEHEEPGLSSIGNADPTDGALRQGDLLRTYGQGNLAIEPMEGSHLVARPRHGKARIAEGPKQKADIQFAWIAKAQLVDRRDKVKQAHLCR